MDFDMSMLSLPHELTPLLNKIAGQAVVVTASASNNTAKDNSIQVCGPVAGTIQYILNLNLHYHAGEIDSCWRLIGGTSDAETLVSGHDSFPRTTQKGIEQGPEELKLQHSRLLAMRKLNTQLLHLHRPGSELMPVLATFDPDTEGNWIASRIVKRLGFQHQQASIHKEVPEFMGQRFERTRIFVDLTCSKDERGNRCRHRFYVVNHCQKFDILLGTKSRL